jgi:hypothetical protein
MGTYTNAIFSFAGRAISFSVGALIAVGILIECASGQAVEPGQWRRTAQGWECAHAIQMSPQKNQMTFGKAGLERKSNSATWQAIRSGHRIALPLAVGSFFVTFGCWLLIGVRNRGIVREIDGITNS